MSEVACGQRDPLIKLGVSGYRCIEKLALLILLLCVFFDPSNQIFGVKTTVFLACLVLTGVSLLHSKANAKILTLVLFVSALFPVLMLVVGVLRQIYWDPVWAINTLKSYMFFSSLLLFWLHQRLVLQLYISLCAFLGLLIIGIFFGFFIGSQYVDTFGQWLSFDVEAAMIGLRTYGQYTFYMIYYKTSVLLIVGIGLLGGVEQRRRFWLFSIFAVALFMSGTRANIAASCFLVAVYFFCYYLHSFRVRLLSICLFSPVALFFAFEMAEHFFDPNELSNSIKMQHFLSYGEIFSTDVGAWLFGQGLGSGFYSIYHQSIAYETELTFLELLRRGGLGALLLWFGILIYPVFKVDDLLSKAAFLAFAIVVMTNPLLISSTGMTALAIAFLFANQGKSTYVQYRS